MYVNNMPFSETLRQAQTDLYDIDTLLLKPLKAKEKIAKRKKIMWRLMSVAEHGVGITFGVMSAIEAYDQRYIITGMYIALMTIGAIAGFDSNKKANTHADIAQKLGTNINETQNIVRASLPEQLHEIAEIARNQKQR